MKHSVILRKHNFMKHGLPDFGASEFFRRGGATAEQLPEFRFKKKSLYGYIDIFGAVGGKNV